MFNEKLTELKTQYPNNIVINLIRVPTHKLFKNNSHVFVIIHTELIIIVVRL